MAESIPETLAGLELFSGASSYELTALAKLMELHSLGAGVVLGAQGEIGTRFWILLDGEVEVTTVSASTATRLAVASRGAILGELAVLRSVPRNATLRTLSACRVVSGSSDALDFLLGIEPVRERIQDIAARRLAQDCKPIPVELNDGSGVLLRPLLPGDRTALVQAVRRLSAESLRRRFFTSAQPSQKLLDYLVDIDFVDHFAWVAIDAGDGSGLATARYVRTDDPLTAEVAFATTDENQGRGIGTVLLGALGVTAQQAGVEHLVAHVLEDNSAMRAVFAKASGTTRRDEPGVLAVTLDPGDASMLIAPALRATIGSAVRDIVTAASVALAGHTKNH
ncbi:MAG: GNAT family N-acetyltransferase [Acidimicrobiales bacterium]